MTVTEESRHRLHQALDGAIGPEEATTLMEHLPPVGWADVATKQDLAHLQADIEHRFAMVDARFDAERTHTDHRFDTEHAWVEHRFAMVDARFDEARQHSEHLFAMARLDAEHVVETLTASSKATNDRLDDLGARLDVITAWMSSMEKRLTMQFWQLLGLVVTFGAILVGVLRYT